MQQGEVKKPPRCAPCACAPNCTTPTVKRKGPALTQLKMPACGVSIERQSGVALPPKDGIDDDRAQSRDQSDRDPATSEPTRPGKTRILDELCATTRLVSRSCPQGAARRPAAAGGAAQDSTVTAIRPESGCGADLLPGHFSKPTEARVGVSAFFVACVSQDQPAAIRASATRIYRTVLYSHPWRVPRE